MLDNNFIAMTNFLSLCSVGKCGNIPDDIDISAVIKFAAEHAVVPLVVSGINKHGKYASEPVVQQILPLSLQMVAKNIQNGYIVKNIFEIFEKEEIGYAVLKGESIASLYKEPDLRISGDIDLLVAEKDEDRALKILDGFGYYYDKRVKWGNETHAKHEKYKMIEVHSALFDESRKDIFFKNVAEEPSEFMKISTANYGEISVLLPDDGILFVFLHFVKHFLSSGAGVRQLMDVIVYSKKYLNEINWERFFNLLKKIKYYKFYTYVISIATELLEIPKSELPETETDAVAALKVFLDLQTGGIFGRNERELEKFKEIYERKRFESFSEGNYDSYKKKFKKSKFRLVFPRMSYMKRNFSYVAKCPPLIVVAWIERIIKAAGKLLTKKSKASDYLVEREAIENDKISERMKLMEELDLI